MLDAQTQTQLTGNRIDTVVKELGRLRQATYSRTYEKKKLAKKRMVDQVGKRMAEHIVGGRPEDCDASAEEGSGSLRLRLPASDEQRRRLRLPASAVHHH